MFSPWLELDGVAAQVAAWSESAGLDLVMLGTTATAEEIQDTAITQPLVVALSLIAFNELRKRVDLPADTPIAGHSVGELAAAAMPACSARTTPWRWPRCAVGRWPPRARSNRPGWPR